MGKTIFGGSEEESSAGTRSGFQTLPKEIKDAFVKFAVQGQNMFSNGAGNNMFKPLDTTAGEQQAINSINQGFAPTASSLQSDISMMQNPYNQYVTDEINRQAQGDNSVLQRNMATAGQYGSNRQMLGANDIDLSRMNQIGMFRQNQFNNELNHAMNTMPGLRMQDAQNKMQAGGFQRNLNNLQQMVPYNALQAWGQLLGVTPNDGGTISNQSSSGSSSPGLLSFF